MSDESRKHLRKDGKRDPFPREKYFDPATDNSPWWNRVMPSRDQLVAKEVATVLKYGTQEEKLELLRVIFPKDSDSEGLTQERSSEDIAQYNTPLWRKIARNILRVEDDALDTKIIDKGYSKPEDYFEDIAYETHSTARRYCFEGIMTLSEGDHRARLLDAMYDPDFTNKEHVKNLVKYTLKGFDEKLGQKPRFQL